MAVLTLRLLSRQGTGWLNGRADPCLSQGHSPAGYFFRLFISRICRAFLCSRERVFPLNALWSEGTCPSFLPHVAACLRFSRHTRAGFPHGIMKRTLSASVPAHFLSGRGWSAPIFIPSLLIIHDGEWRIGSRCNSTALFCAVKSKFCNDLLFSSCHRSSCAVLFPAQDWH